jgi:hypothetical protein
MFRSVEIYDFAYKYWGVGIKASRTGGSGIRKCRHALNSIASNVHKQAQRVQEQIDYCGIKWSWNNAMML